MSILLGSYPQLAAVTQKEALPMGRTFQTHLRVCILRLSLSVLSSLAFAVASGGGEPTPYDPPQAQTATYTLHREASTTTNLFQLKTANPDAAILAVQSANLKNVATGEYIIKAFDTQAGVPNASGVIVAGSSVTFTLWMAKTANAGTMLPRAKLNLNSATGSSICVVTGATALTTTLTKYTLNGTVPANVTMSASDRFYLWVGVNLTATTSVNNKAELDIEGTLNGNYDSLITVPLPTPPPSISNLSPASGMAGTVVTINGANFGAIQGTSTVTFNGTATTPTSWSATSIAVPVPAAATPGPVVVTVNGQASDGVTFTVTPQINSLSPTSGAVGDSVTISGTTFGTTQGTSTVTFNGTAATPTSWSATSIAVPVPAAATTGPVVVTVNGQASNGVTFAVTPKINSLSPTSGAVGDSVTISGTTFGATQGTSTVTFNGANATPSSWGATNIVAAVPSGATTGPVAVTVNGQASNGVTFTVSATGSIDGTITRTSDGAGISGALVEAIQASVVKASTTTAANGSYVMPGVAAGTYEVRVSAIGYQTGMQNGVVVTENTTTTVNQALDAVSGSDTVWVEDALPAGASTGGDESWTWVTSNPSPFSGTSSHQSSTWSGSHQHYFSGATATLSINAGDKLFAYVYIDPNNVPSEIMLQWNDGDWNHRAYWGANNLDFGDDGGTSRHYMGPLPATGQWIRLEVGAVQIGLEGRTLNGMAFSLYGGRVTFDAAGKFPQPPVNNSWVDDRLPAGSSVAGNEPWNWVTSPAPLSGNYAHQSNIVSGFHQHYFQGAMDTLTVSAGEKLVGYVYLDPQNTPTEIMLQWNDGSSWEHRAYWGADQIETSSTRINMGSLPTAGEWVLLEVPASAVNLENTSINGVAFKLYGGRATWDKIGKTTQQATNNPPSVSISSPASQTSYPLPAFVSIGANASDSDGTISKVEFFEGTTQIGQDTSAPYTLVWENVPIGTYTLKAKATDNLNATAFSAEVIITVNPIAFPSGPIPCPSPSPYSIEGDLKEGHRIPIPISLAPCETVNVAVVTTTQEGGAVTLTFHNNVGATILTDNWAPPGTSSLENIPYDSAPWLPPYRGTRGPEGLPMYAIFESRVADVHYNITVTKTPRQKYNLGGNGFANAPLVTSLPANYYGSLWPYEQGQYFRIHLEGNETVYLSGFALGHWFYSAGFQIQLYNSSQQLLTDLVNLTSGGRVEYSNISYTNPSANPADFYLRVTSYQFPIHDFELNIQSDHCSSTAEVRPIAPNASGMGPLAVTSSEYKLPASLDTDVLVPDPGQDLVPTDPAITGRETELWAKVYRPSNLSGSAYPLIVFLHGNHLTCGHLSNPRIDDDTGYTLTGVCGFVPFYSYGAPGTPRNNSAGWYGMKITTGVYPIIIKSLGRQFLTGNNQSHTIKIVKVSDGTAVATAIVTMTAGSDLFRYADLVSPVTLPANTSYYVVSQETIGGDLWADSDATANGTEVATIDGAAASPDGQTNWNITTTPGHTYVKLDFKYDLAAPAEYSVVPSHVGYEYLAQQLSSRGYIVVSINSNRGINASLGTATDRGQVLPPGAISDTYLILARGRLVLKHLQRLSEWSANGGAPVSIADVVGKIDFGNVGLMGHSRGGQGVRAAYVLYHDTGSPWTTQILSPVVFKGIFELAPTDVNTTRLVNGAAVTSSLEPKGTKWNVLLPMCDGDVGRLHGLKPFDRLMVLNDATQLDTIKSTFAVWGANHNYFNTEWQQNDASLLTGCIGDGNIPLFSTWTTNSWAQRQVASESILAFFRANVGASVDLSFNQTFDPRYGLPNYVTSITRVDRGFTSSPDSVTTSVLEDFKVPVSTNYCASPNSCGSDVHVLTTLVQDHDSSLVAARIRWESSGNNQFFQLDRGASNTVNASNFNLLEFRASRTENDLLNSTPASTFSIQLIKGDGSPSASLDLCRYYAKLQGPVGGYSVEEVLPNQYQWVEALHPTLETIRIPLADFTGVDLAHVRGIKFVFNGSSTGSIYIANIRFSN